jgi:hypothetical protein
MQYFNLKTEKEETTWHKWGNNIKVDHKKMGCINANWIHLA